MEAMVRVLSSAAASAQGTVSKVKTDFASNVKDAFNKKDLKPEAIVDEAMSSIREGLQLIANEIGEPSNKEQCADGRKKVSSGLRCLRLKTDDANWTERKVFFTSLSQQLASGDVMLKLVEILSLLDFEARKDVAVIFRQVLQQQQVQQQLLQNDQQQQQQPSQIQAQPSGQLTADAPPSRGFSAEFLEKEYDNDNEAPICLDADAEMAPGGAVRRGGVRNTLYLLMCGYKYASSSAICCGQMLRECAKHENLASRLRDILKQAAIESQRCKKQQQHAGAESLLPAVEGNLFDYVQMAQFDIASDAFATLRGLLVDDKNKKAAAKFLEEEFSTVFEPFLDLKKSPSYVTKRLALKLLGEILHDRNFQHVMQEYIKCDKQLIACMNLLKDKALQIKLEALKVFAVFVVNPKKEERVKRVLSKNKEKLRSCLESFELENDESLQEVVTEALEHLASIEEAKADPPPA